MILSLNNIPMHKNCTEFTQTLFIGSGAVRLYNIKIASMNVSYIKHAQGKGIQ